MRALDARLERFGSLRVDEFVELALYDPDEGFFVTSPGAGRGGADFVTSPEVGPLFGALVAAYLDRRWIELGRPDPFVVVEAAAGRGALAIAVLAADPQCAPALRYVLVERSAALRARQREHLALVHPFEVLGPQVDPDAHPAAPRLHVESTGPLVCSLEELPAQRVTGVVLANELLDNLPFRLLERGPTGWSEVRIGAGARPGQSPVELLVPADAALVELADRLAPDATPGARIPVQEAAVDWLLRARAVLERGSVVAIDYCSSTAELAAQDPERWLRTYRAHERGTHWLDAPGSQDITVQVAADQLAEPTRATAQAQWLDALGIGELVEHGRRTWAERAAVADLAAVRARSRVLEADALCDPDGLGAFGVLEWDL